MPFLSAPSLMPAQRTAGTASLTQRSARSGRSCDTCGDVRLTEIGMTLTDGTSVEFVSCHHCETKLWQESVSGRTVDLSFDTVIAHTRKMR